VRQGWPLVPFYVAISLTRPLLLQRIYSHECLPRNITDCE
jgi:hypothetical protein